MLTSGELAATVFLDGIVRLIPGAISEESLKEESFSPHLDGKKEYPQYTRPETFKNISVPKTLLGGNHAELEKWKRENAK